MRALRELGPNIVIHGGKYYGALLVVIESGVLYSVALVHNIVPSGLLPSYLLTCCVHCRS